MPKKRGPAPISGAQMAEQKDLFIELVSEGLSARKACASGKLPTFPTISKWLRDDGEFRDKYRVAMELRAQKIDDDIDDAIEQMKYGELDAQQARVVIDTYKWRAAKLYPKLYGENQKVEHEHKVVSFVDELKLAAAQIEQQRLADKTIEGEAEEK
jgi:hypothetical protein